MKTLELLCAKERMIFGRTIANKVSRFVEEIPVEEEYFEEDQEILIKLCLTGRLERDGFFVCMFIASQITRVARSAARDTSGLNHSHPGRQNMCLNV